LKASKDKSIAKHLERDYCMLLLIARHGLRVQEALNLKVSDVDFDGMQLNIKRLKQWKRKVARRTRISLCEEEREIR
jgi:integrase